MERIDAYVVTDGIWRRLGGDACRSVDHYRLWADYFAAEVEAIRTFAIEKSTPGRRSYP